jgi:hypothetical protein
MKYALAGISAITTIGVHEWLHASSITNSIPNLTGTTTASIGSVSVGLAVAVVAGVLLNKYVYEMEG